MLESPKSVTEIIENRHFAGAKLIPFAGRITAASYRFGEKQYRLRADSRGRFAIHGFVNNKPFQIERSIANADHAAVVLSYAHPGTTKGYPFKFLVRIAFTLKKCSFTCTTEIRNTDSKPIPIGDGWHPYFKTSGPVDKLLLSLPTHTVVDVSPAFKVPTGEIRAETTGRQSVPLGKMAMDSVFDLGAERRRATTRLIDRKRGLEVQLWQESGRRKYRYLVVYRPPSGTSVAVEPWTSAPNAFNNGMGLMVLKPGGRFKATYGVKLRRRKRSS